jgi:hypothetical protein
VPQSFPNLGMDVFRNKNLIPISRLAAGVNGMGLCSTAGPEGIDEHLLLEKWM